MKAVPIRLGLRENAGAFALLVLVNAFVGAAVGLERAVLPLLAEGEFGVASRTAILAFIASFGAAKALANLAAGALGDRLGRKPVLIAGWVLGLPVPLLIAWAPTWGWVVAANVLLGLNQGLAWSSTVIMKIDLVGPKRRGLAMGINEAAGYMAVALAAMGSGYAAASMGLRETPLVLGLVFAAAGLLLSVFFVRDTKAHAELEARDSAQAPTRRFAEVLLLTSWTNRRLFAASQAGLVNNLNDGLVWGLLPLLLAARGLSFETIGLIAGLYPAVWGVGQLATGAWSDRWGRRPLIVIGMLVQALGLVCLLAPGGLPMYAASMILLGWGTALVYPSLLAAVSDEAHPTWRATSVGVYRLWRDGGYVVGALFAGLVADLLGESEAIAAIAVLTALSGALVALLMKPREQS